RLVVDRRRGDADRAVGHPRRDVAGRPFDQPLPEHVLGHSENVFLHFSTSGLTMCKGRSPSNRRQMSSAIRREWLASVSKVAPPMWGVSTTFDIDVSGWSGSRCSP